MIGILASAYALSIFSDPPEFMVSNGTPVGCTANVVVWPNTWSWRSSKTDREGLPAGSDPTFPAMCAVQSFNVPCAGNTLFGGTYAEAKLTGKAFVSLRTLI